MSHTRITDSYYVDPVYVADFDKKWMDCDLSSGYPVAPYIYEEKKTHNAWRRYKMLPEGVRHRNFTVLEREALHFGQLKLHLGEVDFLSESTARLVVYAGAAPATHIMILVEMFPDIMFHLYDPRRFDILAHDRICINPYHNDHNMSTTSDKYGWFTDQVAASYRNRAVTFISDIRTEATEHEIEHNQRAQQRWITIMQPVASMLKFKLPYVQPGESSCYTYLAGTIRPQCWAPTTSAESRLTITGTGEQTLDRGTYERQMSWYNNVARLQNLGHTVLSEYGIACTQTVNAFWLEHGVPARVRKGSDWVVELLILTRYMSAHPGAYTSLHALVKRINRVMLGNQAFVSRLKF